MGAVGALCFVAGCALTTQEPANLSPHKLEVRAYVDSGRYLRDMEAVAAKAKAWLEARSARGGEKLTVVFDLDETLFFNWPLISAMDFGYIPLEWNRWVEAAKAPPIEPVREVYRFARKLGLHVVFITGRPESQRASTERNLRAIGCSEYLRLICKGPERDLTSAAFKTAERERVVREGWVIIANLGDQQSDLAGGFAERTFKLPNVFYVTE